MPTFVGGNRDKVTGAKNEAWDQGMMSVIGLRKAPGLMGRRGTGGMSAFTMGVTDPSEPCHGVFLRPSSCPNRAWSAPASLAPSSSRGARKLVTANKPATTSPDRHHFGSPSACRRDVPLAGSDPYAWLISYGTQLLGQAQASLAAVKSRDEENVIPVLQLVRLLPLELPVGVVDEHEDAGAAIIRVSR